MHNTPDKDTSKNRSDSNESNLKLNLTENFPSNIIKEEITSISQNEDQINKDNKESEKLPSSSPIRLFCNNLSEINIQNENGWTPIYRSIITNNLLALKELLKFGADPNIPNNLGETPLYLCIDNQNFEMFCVLLENNVNCDIYKKNGNTPLHLAIKKNLENFVEALLLKKANPNILNKLYNQSATHLAIINKYNEKLLKLFKNCNANIYTLKDKYDKTPFDYAKEHNDKNYLDMLIKIFGEKPKEINPIIYWNSDDKGIDQKINILNSSDKKNNLNNNIINLANKLCNTNDEKMPKLYTNNITAGFEYKITNNENVNITNLCKKEYKSPSFTSIKNPYITSDDNSSFNNKYHDSNNTIVNINKLNNNNNYINDDSNRNSSNKTKTIESLCYSISKEPTEKKNKLVSGEIEKIEVGINSNGNPILRNNSWETASDNTNNLNINNDRLITTTNNSHIFSELQGTINNKEDNFISSNKKSLNSNPNNTSNNYLKSNNSDLINFDNNSFEYSKTKSNIVNELTGNNSNNKSSINTYNNTNHVYHHRQLSYHNNYNKSKSDKEILFDKNINYTFNKKKKKNNIKEKLNKENISKNKNKNHPEKIENNENNNTNTSKLFYNKKRILSNTKKTFSHKNLLNTSNLANQNNKSINTSSNNGINNTSFGNKFFLFNASNSIIPKEDIFSNESILLNPNSFRASTNTNNARNYFRKSLKDISYNSNTVSEINNQNRTNITNKEYQLFDSIEENNNNIHYNKLNINEKKNNSSYTTTNSHQHNSTIIDNNSKLNYSNFSDNNSKKDKSKNYIKPLISRNSIRSNGITAYNTYNHSSSLSFTGNYNPMNIGSFRMIPNNVLMRLRDWLISCDLLCYYNTLLKNNIYDIDKYIEGIKENKVVISFKDIEEKGIKKPGHVYRLLIKLQIDAGIIDSNLYKYVNEKFNMNTVTNNDLTLTNSINNVDCCGMNLCSNNNHKKKNVNNASGVIGRGEKNDMNSICYNDIFSFLRIRGLWKLKENFIHNGFDQIEYILLQMFSEYCFDKNILNDSMHIYLEEDKKYVLNILFNEKKIICKELGMKYNSDQLKELLMSQSSSIEYYNNYVNTILITNGNNNNNCCNIF